MAPIFPQDDPGDIGLIGSKPFRQSCLRKPASGVELAHLDDISVGETRIVVGLSSGSIGGIGGNVSTFSVSVGGIISMCADEQMGWANAGRIITFVADDHPIRDGAIRQFPGKSIGSEMFAVDDQSAITALSDVLINPTPSGLSDVLPEPLLWCSHSTGISARSATEPGRSMAPLERPRVIRFTTMLAIRCETVCFHADSLPHVGEPLQPKVVTA